MAKEKRKKVLFCITKGNFGGAQRYVYDIATGLPKSRFESVVAYGDQDGDTLGEKLRESGIPTIKLRDSGREIDLKKDWAVFQNLIKIIKEVQPDTLHLNSSKIGFLGSLAGLFSKIRGQNLNVVFVSHGWAFNERNRSYPARFVYLLAHYFTVLASDHTIAVSEQTKRDIAWLPFISCKIRVIHNGIADFEVLEREEARKIFFGESAPPNDKVVLFSLSELHHNKGLDMALHGIALLPEEVRKDLVYVVAGNGNEKETLEQLALSLGIKDIVRFLGFVPEAYRLLLGADIFLFPSRTENLPFAILEAGFVGLPIIATSVGGIPEVITDMKSGILIHKENPKEIYEAIKYLFENPLKKVEFGDKIKKVIRKSFSQTKMLRETIELLGKSHQ